jgi:hypothetical protein
MSHTASTKRGGRKIICEGRDSAKARGGRKREVSWLGDSHPILASHYYREMVVQVARIIELEAGPLILLHTSTL